MRVDVSQHRNRRGVTAAECGIVYSIVLMMIMGAVIQGLGVFRYEQISHLAREGARWASVHGPTYQQEQNKSAPTSQDVLNNAILPKAVGLDTTQLTCTLTTTSSTVSVTVSYTWVPEGLTNTVTMTSTSVMPISY
jgi:Flp pilus assembly protein TadG